MIKKLILSLVIVFIGYLLLIFTMPGIAGSIERLIGINGFNNSVIELKNIFNDKSTDIPTKSEFLSGAINLKANIVDGVDSTKNKIDSFRETMSGVQDTYNDIKNGYDDVVDFIDTNSGKIDDVKSVIENISDITNTGETN